MSKILLSFFLIVATSGVQSQLLTDSSLLEDPFSNVMFRMNRPVQPIIEQINKQEFESQDEKTTAMVKSLRAMTTASQAPLLSLLQTMKTDNMSITSFWITNEVYANNMPLSVLQMILSFPFLDVAKISKEIKFPILPTFDSTFASAPQEGSVTWGVSAINAPAVWAKGFTGQGVTVGVIDSGCRETHEALAGRINRNLCFDPETGSNNPVDLNGHGTHVTGTIAGQNGIGVAPAAEIIACKGCGTGTCLQNTLIQCGQHMACPTGTANVCKERPAVVSNSWGGSQDSESFTDVLSLWESCNMLPVFAIGNSGSNCKSANSPGDHQKAFAVGAISENKNVTSFSSRGPTASNIIKPEICAPGDKVNSANFLSDNSYKVMSGTSMSTPHISGVAALLLSANNQLTISQLKEILINSCDTSLSNEVTGCGNRAANTFPNNLYGAGLVDADKAFNLAMQLKESKNA